MKNSILLSVVGMPSSGKSTVAQIIKKCFGGCIFSTGDIIRDEIKSRRLKYTPENDRAVSKWFHSGREELLISRLCAKIKKCKNRIIIIEGLRAPVEPTIIRKNLKQSLTIISVSAPFAVRYRRELARKRFKKETVKYLRERDSRELKYGLGKILRTADYKISNSGHLKALKAKTVQAMEKIFKKNL